MFLGGFACAMHHNDGSFFFNLRRRRKTWRESNVLNCNFFLREKGLGEKAETHGEKVREKEREEEETDGEKI